MYISESQIWSLGAGKKPLKKKLAEKLPKNIGGQTCLYPPNPPFLGSKGEKRHFFMKLIQFWVESWYYMSRLTQWAQRTDI